MGSLQILSKRIPSIAPTAQRDIFLSIILLYESNNQVRNYQLESKILFDQPNK
jgi:hypothetical protein